MRMTRSPAAVVGTKTSFRHFEEVVACPFWWWRCREYGGIERIVAVFWWPEIDCVVDIDNGSPQVRLTHWQQRLE